MGAGGSRTSSLDVSLDIDKIERSVVSCNGNVRPVASDTEYCPEDRQKLCDNCNE